MRNVAVSPRRPRRAAELLEGAGLARLDAEVLLAHVLAVDRAALHADPGRLVAAADGERFAALAARRRDGEPVAYLVGRKAFRWIELEVDSRVLVPRPESEGLVDAALALAEGARVVDVGTGSGAVALALKSERPDLRVVATDVSAPALEVAGANAERLSLEIELVESDLLAGVPGPLDAVLANMPYVAEADPLPVDVERFEPPVAVYGGPDGLDLIRRLVTQAVARAPFLALEVGYGQAPAVAALCREAGYARVAEEPDLGGIARNVIAQAC